MSQQAWSYLFVFTTFALYIGIAVWSRVRSTSAFYVAGQGVPAVANGMATAADWMSAASFLSMAGLISFGGYDGTVYLMGWTGGYVLLALLLVPYLRRFGKFTVPDFVGDRFGSQFARIVALLCALFISFTYIAGQMQGVGIVFARFLGIHVNSGVMVGMAIVFAYAVMGGMRGITYTQVAQYCVLIIAYLVPAIAISTKMTGHVVPQIGMGGELVDGPNAGRLLLETLDQIHRDLGFAEYTAAFVAGKGSMISVFAIALTLMVGTAGLPHVLIRFYTVKGARAARWSALWALMFIAVLYTTAPAIAVFARVNMIESLHGTPVSEAPAWFETWMQTDLVKFEDKDRDGLMDYTPDAATNEVLVKPDIIVLANPEIAELPDWVVALVVAGGLAAALSTAAGLLMVISSSISHDLCKRVVWRDMTDGQELRVARISAFGAVLLAGILGIYPPGYVGETVAFAFGLAAASFFPILVLGVFNRRVNAAGAIAGMLTGIAFTSAYIVWFSYVDPEAGADAWLFGIGPKGIGCVGMVLNFAVTLVVSHQTPPPPKELQDIVDLVRTPEP